ncbi:hypothetical protein Hanom_Chr06g00488761 [Helianthus anomalus]
MASGLTATAFEAAVETMMVVVVGSPAMVHRCLNFSLKIAPVEVIISLTCSNIKEGSIFVRKIGF